MIASNIKKFFQNRGFVLGGDINRNDRAGALHRAWGYIFTNHICGDYVEFGVYHGDSFIESYRQYKIFDRWLEGQLTSSEPWRREVAKQYRIHRARFHGLDTFEGMPENKEGNVTFAKGTYMADYEKVRKKCLDNNIPEQAFELYKGLFAETGLDLAKKLSPKIAIANIDCDIYGSAVDALDAVRDRLQVGSILMFDDYNAYSADNKQGERRAFKEFCATVSFKFEPWFPYQYAGQAFLCVESQW